MAETTQKRRERQARRLLRVCLPRLPRGCLEAYVRTYEDDPRAIHSSAASCAVGVMGRGAVATGLEKSQVHYRTLFKRYPRAASHIEAIYEGFNLFLGSGWKEWSSSGEPSWWLDGNAGYTDRKRWIYEACIEDLARRDAEEREAAQAAAEAVGVA